MNPASWLVGRRGQTLALGIACFALLLVWFGIVDPVRSWFDDRAVLVEQRQALLHRMQQVATTLPALRQASMKNSGQAEVGRTTMLPGSNDALAAANLQERVQSVATAAGVVLTAVETLPAAPAGNWRKVSLRVSLNAPWPVLMDLLRSIESAPVHVMIDNIHFHSATIVAHPTVLPVQASMVLYGFRPAEPGAGT